VEKKQKRQRRALVRRIKNSIVQTPLRIGGFRPFATSVRPENPPRNVGLPVHEAGPPRRSIDHQSIDGEPSRDEPDPKSRLTTFRLPLSGW
jgi:hypothetical protein